MTDPRIEAENALMAAVDSYVIHFDDVMGQDKLVAVRAAFHAALLVELRAAWGNSSTADPFKGLRQRIAELEALDNQP